MLKGLKAYFLVKPFFRRSPSYTRDSKACIVWDTFNFVLERVIEWVNISDISDVKMRSNKRFAESH